MDAILAPVSSGSSEASDSRKILLLAPVVKGKKGRHEEVFATLRRNGFVRVMREPVSMRPVA